ncbi:MAG: hypothetical protein DDT27_01028 [Dehalococcoidia bacterium]|nr:hypothetical protein [Chloroflexota bacterium]MBT9162470.1 hypothetical protein [Chloroflexota bacterium]
MQQSGRLSYAHVGSDLRGQCSRQLRDLQAVAKHILPVAKTILETPQQADDLRVQPNNPRLKRNLLPFNLNIGLYLLLCLLYHFLNAPRVDSTIQNEPFQRNPGNLTANRIEAREAHRLGGIINDEVSPGSRFQCPYVASLPTYKPAFHLVTGKGYY